MTYRSRPRYPRPPDASSQASPTTPIGTRDPKDEPQSSYTPCPGLLTPPTSPRQGVREVGAEGKEPANSERLPDSKKLAENKNDLDLGSLRTRLDLSRWKCGSRTKTTGKPCNSPITAGQQVEATSQMQSLISLTQSSPNLEAELRQLAKIVHCRHHDHGRHLGYRVEKWKPVFPPGDPDFKPVVSVEVKIEKLLGELSVCCAGTTKNNKPCRNRMGGRKVVNCSKTIKEIVKPEIYSDDGELEYFLEVFTENRFCHVHKSQGFTQVGIWKSEITTFRDEKSFSEPALLKDSHTSKGHQNPDSTENGLATVRMSSSSQSTTDSSLSRQSTPTPRSSRSSSPAEFWPEEYDIAPFNILATPSHLEDHESSFAGVQRELLTPLRQEDRREGFLYAYEVEGNQGFVKIGYTTRSIKTRHDEWLFDCNRVPKPIYPVASNAGVAVPNAARVEKLCHAELQSRNIRIDCNACLKPHIEWFEISPAEAIAVIEKWSKWMRSHPYQPTSVEASGKWTLKPEEEQRAKDIHRFVKYISQLPSDRGKLESSETGRENVYPAAYKP